MKDARDGRVNKIQLLYAANEITEEEGLCEQNLYFFVLVENIAFAKNIDVVWAGEDGVWHTLPAAFHSWSEHKKEYWNATATFRSPPDSALPCTIQFALRYRVKGKEYWDNNHGHNYICLANSCIQYAEDRPMLNLGQNRRLIDAQLHVPITVAINHPLQADNVSIHWTTDDWHHTNITPCNLKNSLELERDDCTIEEGAQIWSALLKIDQDFRLQYCICCESGTHVLWDNNGGRNYSASRKPLNVLVLNLHCCQEDNQDFKFTQIAKAIDELCVDVVCFQEVAENWNDGRGDWETNSVKIINDRLKNPYHIHTDWSHLGFKKYREGVAILSRYPIAEYDARYISNSHDRYSIHSRKVVMGKIPIPYFGPINFFSVHASWWDDGFPQQFENLQAWANAHRNGQVKATLLCGDFNIKAGSKGYQRIVNSKEYEDQFLAANAPEVFENIFRNQRQDWQHYLDDDHRIDYIFMDKSSGLRVASARFVFTRQEYGRVSDHEGLLMTFEPA
jgi:maltose 6'-phosphate phosphatase